MGQASALSTLPLPIFLMQQTARGPVDLRQRRGTHVLVPAVASSRAGPGTGPPAGDRRSSERGWRASSVMGQVVDVSA